MAAMPKVIKNIVMSDSAIIQPGTLSRRLLQNISTSPRNKSGMKFSQNLLHNNARKEMGAV